MKEYFFKAWDFLKGKKSYFVVVCAIVYGIYANDKDALILGLGLLGIRHGISTEVARLIKKK